MQEFSAPTEQSMHALGMRCARQFVERGDALVFLCGALGVGKTTFARGVLAALGHHGATPSPTYTLCEHYPLRAGDVYHLDLYRLRDPAELEMLGFRDLITDAKLMLIEWPQRAAGQLPPADVEVSIHCIENGQRQVHIRQP